MVLFGVLCLPYRWCFKHRSRFSHGLILGALLRVVYFLGVSTLLVYLIAFCVSSFNGSSHYDLGYFTDVWRGIGEFVRANLGNDFCCWFSSVCGSEPRATLLQIWREASSRPAASPSFSSRDRHPNVRNVVAEPGVVRLRERCGSLSMLRDRAVAAAS
ncbi:MAG: DUF2227 family putative metal-binding protein [Acidobacteria bacterium]|nr:DUF2227 family putative metal-binding protein [Acidobacteriota bacterium]